MRDFWNNAPMLAIILGGTILFYGLGVLIHEDNKQNKARYEQCITANMQWVKGNGYDSYHPNDPSVTNRDLLAAELGDVNAVLNAMGRDELRDYSLQDTIGNRWRKKLRFAHHQEETK